MRDAMGFTIVTLVSMMADIQRQMDVLIDPQQGVDWFSAAFEYGAIAVLAYIFYRLWDRSQKRQNEVVNDRIAELEHERDYWRGRAVESQDAHLNEVKNNREQYREFLLPHLRVSEVPLVQGDDVNSRA